MSAPSAKWRVARVHLNALCLAALITSCAKDPAPSEDHIATSSTSAPAPASTISAPPAAPAASVDLAELTQVVRKFAAEKRRVPKSLEEVVAAGYLPSVPAPPAGQKFGIDKNLQVYLAAQ